MTTKKRVKAGTSKASAADRRGVFVEAFLSNGNNATKAAITAGFSAHTADRQGARLLKDVRIASVLDKRRTELAASNELNTEKIVREIGRLALSDPRNITHPDGSVKLPHELDEATAAAIASFEVGFDGSIKYKFWDKNSALDKAAKVLGLYEKDNRQKTLDPIEIRLVPLMRTIGSDT